VNLVAMFSGSSDHEKENNYNITSITQISLEKTAK
jgi:hypothetical protein